MPEHPLGTPLAESGIPFDEPDVLHSSYPAVFSQILFTTRTYGCLHVERNYSLSLLSHLYLTLTNLLLHHFPCLGPADKEGIAVHFPNVKMAIQLCQSIHTWGLMGRIGHPY